jgi:hypothetical protein
MDIKDLPGKQDCVRSNRDQTKVVAQESIRLLQCETINILRTNLLDLQYVN